MASVDVVTIRIDRAARLRDQVMKTWDPPERGMASLADIAQTATMQVLAWVMGREFLPNLTQTQDKAITASLEMLERVLKDPNEVPPNAEGSITFISGSPPTDMAAPEDAKVASKAEMLKWLQRQIEDTNKNILARQQSEDTWRNTSEADWKAVCGRKTPPEAERIRLADIDRRIANRYLEDLRILNRIFILINCLPE